MKNLINVLHVYLGLQSKVLGHKKTRNIPKYFQFISSQTAKKISGCLANMFCSITGLSDMFVEELFGEELSATSKL